MKRKLALLLAALLTLTGIPCPAEEALTAAAQECPADIPVPDEGQGDGLVLDAPAERTDGDSETGDADIDAGPMEQEPEEVGAPAQDVTAEGDTEDEAKAGEPVRFADGKDRVRVKAGENAVLRLTGEGAYAVLYRENEYRQEKDPERLFETRAAMSVTVPGHILREAGSYILVLSKDAGSAAWDSVILEVVPVDAAEEAAEADSAAIVEDEAAGDAPAESAPGDDDADDIEPADETGAVTDADTAEDAEGTGTAANAAEETADDIAADEENTVNTEAADGTGDTDTAANAAEETADDIAADEENTVNTGAADGAGDTDTAAGAAEEAGAEEAETSECELFENNVPAAESIELPASLSVGIGESVALEPVYLPEGSRAEGVTWKSSVKTTASVSAAGVVRGLRLGTSVVTITLDGGVTASCKVTVLRAPTSVSLSAKTLEMGLGEELTLKHTLPNGCFGRVTWTSDNESAVTVTPEGKLRAKAMGSTKITVRTYNGKTASCAVTVLAAPGSVAFDEEELLLGAGDRGALCAKPEGFGAGKVTYTSSDPGIASVDPVTGSVTAVSAGEATIRATAYNGVFAQARVTVMNEPSAFSFEDGSITVGVGEVIPTRLVFAEGEYGSVKYTSSSRYAAVKADGSVKGVIPGTVTVTATAYNGKKATCRVTIKKAPLSVSLDAKTAEMGIGEEGVLRYTLPAYSAGNVTWSSDNEAVAAVTQDGRLRAVSAGEAKVTVRTYNGKTASCAVTVRSAPASVVYDADTLLLGAGDAGTLTARAASGSAGRVTYASLSDDIASVDPVTGRVTAVSAGEAVIRATAYNGVYADARVTVMSAPSAFAFAQGTYIVGVGETISTRLVFAEGEYGSVKYTSNYRNAAVNADGVVKGVTPGTVTVTATAYNGKKATCKVTIQRAPTSVSLSEKNARMGLGDEGTLKYTLPANTTGNVTWASDNEAVVAVTQEGKLRAVSLGDARVTVRTYNGKTASCTVTVVPAPESVIFETGELLLGAGDAGTVSAHVEETGAGTIRYTSLSSDVASVDPVTGRVTAVSKGETAVRATAYNGVHADIRVRVMNAPETFAFEEKTYTVGVGETISTRLVFAEGEYGSVKYTVNYRNAAVNADGVVKGVTPGTVTVTATAYNGKKATCKVTIMRAPTSVSLSEKNARMGLGDEGVLKYTLPANTAGNVTWASDNEAVVAVTQEGKLRAVSLGDARVTVRTYNGKTASCTVTVVPAPESVIFETGELLLGAGDAGIVSAHVEETSAGSIRYTSLSEDIASVDPVTGKVTAVSKGETAVRATAYNGVHADIRVRVMNAPETFAFEEKTYTVGVGETIPTKLVFAEGEYGSVKYTVNYRNASVNAEGLVKGVTPGTITVTATAYNGKKATCKVTIMRAPTSVSLSEKNARMGLGDEGVLKYTLPANTAGNVTWSSADDAIVTVTDEGKLRAVSLGDARVTVRTYNGKTASCTVTVVPAPESVIFETGELLLGAGDAGIVSAHVEETSAGSIRYTSLSEDIASVDPVTGKVTAVSKGETAIRATAYNGVYADIGIKVMNEPTVFAFSQGTYIAGIGETVPTKVVFRDGEYGGVKYTSSSRYVTVKSDGSVRGTIACTATITATAYNGKKATCRVTVMRAPGSVSLDQKIALMGLGDEGVLKYTLPANTAGNVTWSSADDEIVTVTDEGKLRAVAPGEARVTVRTYNGKTASCTVTVVPAPVSVIFDTDELLLGAGDAGTVFAHVEETSAGTIRYTSLASDIASVDPVTGRVTAVSMGETAIRATAYNGVYADIRVKVMRAPSSVAFAQGTYTVGVGQRLPLAIVFPDGEHGSASFKSSASAYAGIDANGVVKGNIPGTVTITATTYNGKKATCRVNIRKAPLTVTADPKNVALGIGEELQLGYTLPSGTAAGVTWASDDEAVARVTEDGKAVGVSIGTAHLTVKTHNGKTAVCTAIVTEAPGGLAFPSDTLSLPLGITYLYPAGLTSGHANSFTYASDNTSSVLAGPDGALMAAGIGSARITARTYNGLTASVTVTVTRAPEEMLADWPRVVEKGSLTCLTDGISLYPADAAMTAVTGWTVTGKAAVLETRNGKTYLRAIAGGSVTVTCATYNGLKYSQTIAVYEDPLVPVIIEIDGEKRYFLNEDAELALYATVLPETSFANTEWVSSRVDIAVVDADGCVTGVDHGLAVISCRSKVNGKVLASVEVLVSDKTVLFMPAWVTDTDGISDNKAAIDAIRRCALNELAAYVSKGKVSSSSSTQRKQYINNIFTSYSFAWVTQEAQKYWSEKYSENGAKDFDPGVVYYGLPYISGSYTNRTYNVKKALDEDRYVDSGKGYYVLNRSKLIQGLYVGTDCSSLINGAVYGTGSSYIIDRTNDMAKSGRFVRIEWKDLAPGDILLKSADHVVMFLYWADAAHTQVVIIENGGEIPGTNTVHTDVRDVSYYRTRGLLPYRIKGL